MLPKKIDIIYGGFPCQDISAAGLRVGLGGERSGLFFEIMRLAKEIKPKLLFLENVGAINSNGLETIGENLATLGYDCRWDTHPAYFDTRFFKGDRWFCLAKAKSQRLKTSGYNQRLEKKIPIHHLTILADVWHPAVDPMAGAVDGLSVWTHAVASLGNAVVPHQAKRAFKYLAGLN